MNQNRLGLGPVFAQIAQFHPELTAFRRDLHAHPELGFEEVYTSNRVIEALKVCGVDEIHTGLGKTGVVAVINGQHPATPHATKMVGLRADMDALPLHEHNEFTWRSTQQGLMHACGHDGHTAMLIGAARYLAQTRRFSGQVALIFQPGEEGYAGARAMMEDGLFDRFPCDKVFAQHNSPEAPLGFIGVTPGPMQAAADRIEIRVRGRGGHGARPHQTVDPVLVSGHLITAIQSLISRNLSAFDQAVISICALQAGHVQAMSVIPEQVLMVGTVRTYTQVVQDDIERRLTHLCQTMAQSFGATAEVNYERGYPATVNTPEEAHFVADVAAGLVGEERVLRNMIPSMGAEDFSYMLQAKPGAYIRIGQGAADGPGKHPLHNSRYDFNDDILPLGAALHASLVEAAMPL
ncbi:MAG: putative hydrolase YxeP [Pseudomonadota bacterium]|jgi:hippurate hydrolase